MGGKWISSWYYPLSTSECCSWSYRKPAGDFENPTRQKEAGAGWRTIFAEWIGDGSRQHEVRSIHTASRSRFTLIGLLSLILPSHLPSHSSREVFLLLSSLTSCDPGSVSQTISALQTSKIRVSVVCLAAETKLSRELATKTGGSFGVALNEGHLKDLIWEEIPPPALTTPANSGVAAKTKGGGSDLMMMGFPTKLPDSGPASLCACHSSAQVFKPEGFLCPRCGAKLCEVPTDCEVCGLLVVSSPHLARSYHHLFPVAGWLPVYVPFSLSSPSDFITYGSNQCMLDRFRMIWDLFL